MQNRCDYFVTFSCQYKNRQDISWKDETSMCEVSYPHDITKIEDIKIILEKIKFHTENVIKDSYYSAYVIKNLKIQFYHLLRSYNDFGNDDIIVRLMNEI